MSTSAPRREWPGATLARVPYWVYGDETNYRDELRRIFEGPVWNYVALKSDLARTGDYCTTFVGEMPVVVVRGETGEIHAFENRCAHRGALIALDDSGSTGKHFQCVYHAWSYDLRGGLVGAAFEKGANGKGGMPESFCKADHGPRQLRPIRHASTARPSALSRRSCANGRTAWRIPPRRCVRPPSPAGSIATIGIGATPRSAANDSSGGSSPGATC